MLSRNRAVSESGGAVSRPLIAKPAEMAGQADERRERLRFIASAPVEVNVKVSGTHAGEAQGMIAPIIRRG
jgi:hypothetical protein